MIEQQNFNIAWNLPQLFSDSTKQVGESLKTTADTATDAVINTLSSASQQAKGAIDQTFQNTIAYSVGNWLEDYPSLINLLNILGWATKHPIISLIAFIFFCAIIFSIIKAIGRVIETASWSLFKIPFQLIFALLTIAFNYVTKIAGYSFKQITKSTANNTALALNAASFESIIPDKQQRLTEISVRLEELQKEQNQLLQEAAELVSSENTNHKLIV